MKRVWKSMDYSLLLPLVILCVLGVIMVYSSSSIVAISSRYNWPADYFFKKQLLALAIGTVILVIVVIIPYKFWRKGMVLAAMGLGSLVLLAAAYLFR
ncbi:FtsW/RodA/SpoVE family cell cycle protein [Bacillus pacificus]